jgi:hypothetical protein
MIKNERFGLAFAKTGSINSGTGLRANSDDGRESMALCLPCVLLGPIRSSILPEPVFLNVYGAPESIPRNEFRQPM